MKTPYDTDTPQGLLCPECGRTLTWNDGALRCNFTRCPILGRDQAEPDAETTALQTPLKAMEKRR